MELIEFESKISVKSDEFFSMLVFKDISAKHSGRYTCYASNSAATVNYTSELLVKGMIFQMRHGGDISHFNII